MKSSPSSRLRFPPATLRALPPTLTWAPPLVASSLVATWVPTGALTLLGVTVSGAQLPSLLPLPLPLPSRLCAASPLVAVTGHVMPDDALSPRCWLPIPWARERISEMNALLTLRRNSRARIRDRRCKVECDECGKRIHSHQAWEDFISPNGYVLRHRHCSPHHPHPAQPNERTHDV